MKRSDSQFREVILSETDENCVLERIAMLKLVIRRPIDSAYIEVAQGLYLRHCIYKKFYQERIDSGVYNA